MAKRKQKAKGVPLQQGKSPQASAPNTVKKKNKKNSSARKRARAEKAALDAGVASASDTANNAADGTDTQEVEASKCAKSDVRSGGKVKIENKPSSKSESNDSSDSEADDDSADPVESAEYLSTLEQFLSKNGPTHIGIIGRTVPRPDGLQIGKFFTAHRDRFIVNAGKVSLR
eukprot:TRINITY_DN64671_c0_g1_i1.p2 TRINITY_DN64671_c0_g1~~TRINITY_DN64671_c0_g1_i1.p2  ORF type:complete len:194 (-),score=36.94 TRINITY_DN64671_c0_g1_i1:194-712(-)